MNFWVCARERIPCSADFYFCDREEFCVPASLVRNWNLFYRIKSVHFVPFSAQKLLQQKKEEWVAKKIRTILNVQFCLKPKILIKYIGKKYILISLWNNILIKVCRDENHSFLFICRFQIWAWLLNELTRSSTSYHSICVAYLDAFCCCHAR